MKKLKLLFTIFLFSISRLCAQKTFDAIESKQLYLRCNNQNISFNAISNSSIKKLLGKPVKVSIEKWETTEDFANTYVYKDGQIDIEDKAGLSFITIKNKRWSFIFKQSSTFTKPFTIGSNANDLISVFPHSVLNKKTYSITIPITVKGKTIDSSIIFEVIDNIIISAGLFANES